MTIPTNLIESALKLTGSKPDFITEDVEDSGLILATEGGWKDIVSIEKFSYFLLSENFINSYIDATVQRGKTAVPDYYSLDFLKAIRQNESGNPGPLIDLLTKIPGNPPTS